MKQILIAFSALILLAACKSPEQKTTTSEPSFPLKAYVETEDKAFRYEIVETIKGDSWTEYRIYMVSGTWFTHEEVDEPEWWHWLTMVVPDDVQETESLMLIGGGWRGDTIPIAANEEMIQAALATGSVVKKIPTLSDNIENLFYLKTVSNYIQIKNYCDKYFY